MLDLTLASIVPLDSFNGGTCDARAADVVTSSHKTALVTGAGGVRIGRAITLARRPLRRLQS
jgi:hypothetical protein